MSEQINHPPHYGGDTVYEAIKVIEAWDLGFNLGNAVKYISRAGRKDGSSIVTDLRKAHWYLDREIQKLVGSQDNNKMLSCRLLCGDNPDHHWKDCPKKDEAKEHKGVKM